ncbi:MAG: hypothetical protein FWB76_05065 [Oscillospiraceae bacterium]|nr:hypothetical protein [Oscillospiraceae bacterium]
MKKLVILLFVVLLVLGFAVSASASPDPVPYGEHYIWRVLEQDGVMVLIVNRSAVYVYDNGRAVQLTAAPGSEREFSPLWGYYHRQTGQLHWLLRSHDWPPVWYDVTFDLDNLTYHLAEFDIGAQSTWSDVGRELWQRTTSHARGGYARGNADEAEIVRFLARLQRNANYRPPAPTRWVCICCNRRVNRNGGAPYTNIVVSVILVFGLPIALVVLSCLFLRALRRKRKKLETE